MYFIKVILSFFLRFFFFFFPPLKKALFGNHIQCINKEFKLFLLLFQSFFPVFFSSKRGGGSGDGKPPTAEQMPRCPGSRL
jgi:hypothetical protein